MPYIPNWWPWIIVAVAVVITVIVGISEYLDAATSLMPGVGER